MLAAGLSLAAAGRAQAQTCDDCSGEFGGASSDASQPMTNFFGSSRFLQAMSDQVNLSRQGGPLPFTLSGNIQAWTSGPPQEDLYTEIAQLAYKLNDEWTVLGQQLYQQQASIELWNFVGGFGYQPTDDFSVNVMAGFGVHTLYTYEWATYISPQYTLPLTIAGEKRIALGANFTVEKYALGTFYQAQPRVSLKIASWLPQLQIGYAFGDFDNSTETTKTQYYQPQPVSGFSLTAVFHPFEPIYAVVTYLPENRNYIAGNYSIQSTVSGTLHMNWTTALRTSLFYQDTWYQGGGDQAFGGGLSLSF
ncbi:hypothetical protein [Ancylobacter terrae]|uniref:hypothetical protein n=1 Tax=Ancylobacter sp. sgz301288 TaxID=3342077 RepID=UPI00385C857A